MTARIRTASGRFGPSRQDFEASRLLLAVVGRVVVLYSRHVALASAVFEGCTAVLLPAFVSTFA
jgi:hypothetical protein